MNIVILNGNPGKSNYAFDRYMEFYRIKLHKSGHYVRSFMLRDMRLNEFRLSESPNTTNNREYTADDFRYIINSLHDTDLLVMASPLEQGFISILSKMVFDRLAPVMDPSENMTASIFRKSQNMSKIPLLGFITQKEPCTSGQDLLLNKLTVERMAANLHTVLNFFITMDSDVGETFNLTIRSIDYRYYIEETFNGFISGSQQPG